jgi:hypothetical protein
LDRLGRIIVSGYAAAHDFAVVRYHPNGCLDSSFSGDGKAITDFLTDDRVGGGGLAVALDESGRIVVTGTTYSTDTSDNDITVVRHLGGGKGISAFKQNTEGAPIEDWLMTLTGPEPKSARTLGDGCVAWTVTQSGTYTVTEENQADWTPQGATSADFAVTSDGGSYSHTFVNFKDVRVTVCKRDIVGAPIEDWLMTLTGPDPKSGKTTADGCITWTATKPGAYTVIEEDRGDWWPRGATSADFTAVSGGGPYSHTFVNSKHTCWLPLIRR